MPVVALRLLNWRVLIKAACGLLGGSKRGSICCWECVKKVLDSIFSPIVLIPEHPIQDGVHVPHVKIPLGCGLEIPGIRSLTRSALLLDTEAGQIPTS
ncbi:hypothetical protein Nepgr_002889 [Nepenthes gracilis]|uniref:Secreted protein n=1 Tax=Nepenthes gracilis TaxID=150966 RepID=A0AAD3P4F0_NEPGR|nr:hypothetical protein Nepgr_002889 [Nepenthes gracilis]